VSKVWTDVYSSTFLTHLAISAAVGNIEWMLLNMGCGEQLREKDGQEGKVVVSTFRVKYRKESW
jgi:hypothetical protein